MAGLFFREKLQKRFQTFKLPEKHKQLMIHFETKAAEMFTDQQRADKFGWVEGDAYLR
jgi:hypothetical protein